MAEAKKTTTKKTTAKKTTAKKPVAKKAAPKKSAAKPRTAAQLRAEAEKKAVHAAKLDAEAAKSRLEEVQDTAVEYARKGVDVPVGAALNLADRVSEVIEDWSDQASAEKKVKGYRADLTKTLKRAERRGSRGELHEVGRGSRLSINELAARTLTDQETLLCATRYGNVMASRGSVIPLFIQQLREDKPLTVTDPEMTRFLMSLDESVDLVLHAFAHGRQGDIFVQKAPAATKAMSAVDITT